MMYGRDFESFKRIGGHRQSRSLRDQRQGHALVGVACQNVRDLAHDGCELVLIACHLMPSCTPYPAGQRKRIRALVAKGDDLPIAATGFTEQRANHLVGDALRTRPGRR